MVAITGGVTPSKGSAALRTQIEFGDKSLLTGLIGETVVIRFLGSYSGQKRDISFTLSSVSETSLTGLNKSSGAQETIYFEDDKNDEHIISIWGDKGANVYRQT